MTISPMMMKRIAVSLALALLAAAIPPVRMAVLDMMGESHVFPGMTRADADAPRAPFEMPEIAR
jgi:hypothetical protein